jgi:hypothetical protein
MKIVLVAMAWPAIKPTIPSAYSVNALFVKHKLPGYFVVEVSPKGMPHCNQGNCNYY